MSAPALIRERRLLGISPDGHRVNNVTKENRFDVNPSNPHLSVALKSEDLRKTLHLVYIPNTREMPDAVLHEGVYYEVYDSTMKPPVYKLAFVATTYQPNEKDDTDGTTD